MQKLGAMVVLAVLCGSAADARAQTPARPRFAVGIASGSVLGVLSDDSDPKRWLGLTMRRDVSRHWLLEGELAHWSRVDTNSFSGVTTRNTFSEWTAGVNVLAHTNGRVAGFGGPGVFAGTGRRAYETTIDCGAPSHPPACGPFTRKRGGSGVGVQAIGGVDVAVAPAWQFFVQARAAAPPFGPRTVGAAAGLRFQLK